MQRGCDLQKTILSTADVARLFNVTETTVKRWANDGTLKCMKTPGGHRKFEMKNVVEFAATLNFEPLGALTLTDEQSTARRIQTAILSRDFNILKDVFLEKALSYDKRDLFVYLSYLYQHRVHLWEIYDLVIAPGMELIGAGWEKGQYTIEQEHRASHETADAMAKLQTQIAMKPYCGLSVLCACPGEEQHDIGLRCASNLFEAEGWLTLYLGARTPYNSIVNAAQEMHASVVCLSRTMPLNDPAERVAFAEMLEKLRELGKQTLIGGKVVRTDADLIGDRSSTYRSSLELVTFVRKFEEQVAA